MHTTSSRIQNAFGFFTTVAFFVGALTALSVVLYPHHATADIDIKSMKVVRGRPQYYSTRTQDYLFSTFSLSADLTPLFNWNTKQVFAYVSIVYGPDPTLSAVRRRKSHTDNEVVVWDAIITRKEAAKLVLAKERAKYNVNDISGKWGAGRNATMRFAWNVQPHVGALVWGSVDAPVVVEEEAVEGEGEGEEVKEKKIGGWRFEMPAIVPAKPTAKKANK